MSSHQGSESEKADDPRLTASSDVANSGEANSASVVRSAAGARNTTNEYVDPEIPSSSTAAASSGEATSSLGDLYGDSPPRPFQYNVFEDPTSMFNIEFREDTPRRRPSRVIGAPHFLDGSFEWYAETEKEYWYGLYRDGYITKARYEEVLADLQQEKKNRQLRRRLANIADLARQQKASNDGSSSADDAAASETPAIGVTDTDALDFPLVVSSGVVSGTTAPSTPVTSNASSIVEPADAFTEADKVLNIGFAASSVESSSVADQSAQHVADQSGSSQMSDNQQSSSNHMPTDESRNVSVDLMRGNEVLEGEDAENFCATLRFRPRHQQRQQAEVEFKSKDNNDEEDSDEIQDLSTSFALIGLTSRSTDVDDDVDAMSKSLANISVATAETSQSTRDSTVSSGIPASTNASQVAETTDDLTQFNIPLMPLHPNADPDPTMFNFAVRPTASSATRTRTRSSQRSNASARVKPRNLPDELTSYNVQNDAFKEAVETTSNILERNPEFIYVDPMSPLNEANEPSTSTAREDSFESMDFEDAETELLENEAENTMIVPWFFCQPSPSPEDMIVDEILEPIEVDDVSEAMEVDQLPEQHNPTDNDVDFEMIDESIESNQSTTINIISSSAESSKSVPSEPIQQVAFVEPSQNTPAQGLVVEAHAIPEVHATVPMDQSPEHVVSLNGTTIGFSSSMHSNPIVEEKEVHPAMAPEEEESLVVNAAHSETFNVQPPASDIPESNTTIESSETTSSIANEPAPAHIVDHQPSAEITIQNLNTPTVLGSSESLHEAPAAEQGTDSSLKQASEDSQATKEIDSQEKPSRDRLNEVAEHHRRRAMFPSVRFSPQHSVMKRQSAQRSRLALICHINRQRTQQMMKIRPYNVVVEKPVIEVAAHHQRQRETTAATQDLPESSLPHPITAGQPSRLALIEANRALIQQLTTTTADQAPRAVNAEVPENDMTSNVVVAEPTSPASPSLHSHEAMDVPTVSATSQEIGSPNVRESSERDVEEPAEQPIGSSLPQRKFRRSHLERAFAEQHRKAPITRQELASFNAFVEQANRDRETSNAVRPSLQPPRRPFQTRIGRIWNAIKDDGRPIGQAIQSPAPYYSNDESIIRRKQEGAQCQASSSTASMEDTEGPTVSGEVVVATSAEAIDNESQEPAVEAESEEVEVAPEDAADDASQDHEAQGCNHPHIVDLPKHSCAHNNADVMKKIARHYVMCHLCGMPIAPRLITETDNEVTDSEDEPESEGIAEVDNASEARVVPVEADAQLDASENEEEEVLQDRQDEVVEVEREASDPDDAENVDDHAAIAALPSQVEHVPGEVNELHVNDFDDDIPALEHMSEPDEADSIAPSDASESNAMPSRKRRHRSNTTDREISIRQDDSPPDDSSGNEDSSNGSAESSDEEAPPPPRRRRRINQAEWGQLRHIVNIEGANLPNAPPFVARQREVYGDISLAATEQIQVVRGIDFHAALYRSGHVVYRGVYRGAPTGARIFREAREQPVLVWQDMENRVVRIAAGDDHLVMLTISGEVHTIGRSAEGQLGIPDLRGFRQSVVTPASMLRPIHNAAGQDVFITDIRAHGNVTEAKMRNGTVYRCGDGILQFTEVNN